MKTAMIAPTNPTPTLADTEAGGKSDTTYRFLVELCEQREVEPGASVPGSDGHEANWR